MLSKFMSGNIAFSLIGLLGLMIGLTSCAPQDMSVAIVEWKAAGKSDKIIKQLYNPSQSIREQAIATLGEMKAQEAIEPLGALFLDPDLIVVHAAVDAVAEIGGPEIEAHMLEAITLETVPARETSATALGNFESEAAVDALIISLDDYRYEQVVLATIQSLGKIGHPKAVEPLGKKLQERSETVRSACITSLQQIGDEAAFTAISTRLGDLNDDVRALTVETLVAGGKLSAPSVLQSLRDENYVVRANALEILNKIDAVPESGNDLIWFRLAELTAEKEITVKAENADVFSVIDSLIPALLEALAHPSQGIRDYAAIALENVGEDAVADTLALAKKKAKSTTLEWLEHRSKWTGAPSWKIDLWGASAAINPNLNFNNAYADLLEKGGAASEKVMKAQQFIAKRELIPFLLLQFRKSGSNEPDVKKQEGRVATLATKHIMELEHQAVFPLLSALNGSDQNIAIESARVLNIMGGERIERLVVDSYFQLFEYGPEFAEEEAPEAEETPDTELGEEAAEEVEEKKNLLFELSGTPLHLAIYEFDMPELDPLRMRIRPSVEIAIRDFKEKHPDMTVVSLPLPAGVTPTYDTVPVRLSYYKNKQMNDLKVIYGLNTDKIWKLDTPIPDSLP